MDNRLEQLNCRYDEISAQLSAPETYQDAECVARLNREQRELEGIVQGYRRLCAAREARAAAALLLKDEDAQVRERAREERAELIREGALREAQLEQLRLGRDPMDDRDIILEIRAGVGGEEAALFAHSLGRMYAMYAARQGWTMQPVNVLLTELGGIRESVYTLSGAGVFARMKYESGTHRVQRVPETESGGRIHTSTATVAVLPQVDAVEFELDMSQVRVDTFRSSGAGGQHVNKTESAIRLTHLPTGTVVECQDERSQYKNKDRAMEILRARLYDRQRREQESAVAARRRSQIGMGMRNERIRTYNFPQGRVTDHRIGLTLQRIDAILDGDLNLVVDSLMQADRAEQLMRKKDESEL